jgi:hypothetical protein
MVLDHLILRFAYIRLRRPRSLRRAAVDRSLDVHNLTAQPTTCVPPRGDHEAWFDRHPRVIARLLYGQETASGAQVILTAGPSATLATCIVLPEQECRKDDLQSKHI